VKRYLVDNALNWPDDAFGLTIKDFLKRIEEAEEGLDAPVPIEAESLFSAANKALGALRDGRAPKDSILVFDVEAKTLHHMHRVFSWEER
jgi:hypothetical protein